MMYFNVQLSGMSKTYRISLAVFILLFHLSPSVHDKEDNSLRSEVILLAANSWVHHKERDKYTEVLIQQKPMALV